VEVFFNENACYVAGNTAYIFILFSAMQAPWFKQYFASLPFSDWNFSLPEFQNWF